MELGDRNSMTLDEFRKRMDTVFESKAFPAVDLLYEKSYLTKREADELKTRRKFAAEINSVICKHYTFIEGRLVYMRKPVAGDLVRFIFCQPDDNAEREYKKDFMIEVEDGKIELKEF